MSQVKVTLTDLSGQEHELVGNPGQSVMEIAVASGVDGIEAQCGGACSCATCHIYVADEWMAAVGEPDELESDMLDFAGDARQANSRLSCQIKLAEELDGLKAHVAEI